jgi:hypothetical protein
MSSRFSAQSARDSHWQGFTLGMLVGLTVAGAAIAALWLTQRSARGSKPESTDELSDEGVAASTDPSSDRLDEELDETFPASDPLPYSHRVD